MTGKDSAKLIPIGVSARHVHLSEEDVIKLFGENYYLTKDCDLKQKGQYASNEKVSIISDSREIENVRVLGPTRKETQVEISRSDAWRLKLNPPVRNSGDLKGSPGITLKGPCGTVKLDRGCIIATRHIHMTPEDAALFNVSNGETRSIIINTEKGGIMFNVYIKVNPDYVLEMHIDIDDANAFLLNTNDLVSLNNI